MYPQYMPVSVRTYFQKLKDIFSNLISSSKILVIANLLITIAGSKSLMGATGFLGKIRDLIYGAGKIVFAIAQNRAVVQQQKEKAAVEKDATKTNKKV